MNPKFHFYPLYRLESILLDIRKQIDFDEPVIMNFHVNHVELIINDLNATDVVYDILQEITGFSIKTITYSVALVGSKVQYAKFSHEFRRPTAINEDFNLVSAGKLWKYFEALEPFGRISGFRFPQFIG